MSAMSCMRLENLLVVAGGYQGQGIAVAGSLERFNAGIVISGCRISADISE